MTHEHDEQEPDLSIPPKPFDADISILTVGAERPTWLAALIETARDDLRPRDLVERHLVDEMAINKWRLLRIYGMEKAVYEHQLASFRSTSARKANGELVEPNEDLYHLARAHAPDHDAVILAALSRLEARFHRQFYAALKMLIALRKVNPVSPKGESTCQSISESSSDQATTKQPNKSKPNSSQ